ncbi:MAG TPA: Mur ligase family protein [Caulobacterales bacterium]|nr:Mur ligase family protein [Caulobacterales bacterium]
MSEDRALHAFEQLFGPEFGHGRAFDLAPLNRALKALGDPQEKLPPTIHVAGTNGKGSTIAFMRAIAEAAGLRVHVFSKPHILNLRERFRVANALASDEALIAAAGRIAATNETLTQFEAQVAAAFLLFAETPADVALLETGLGGRDDATNVVAHPVLCVLTPIDLDHQDALGATLAEIAAHKAGILKPGVPTIVTRQRDEAQDVIEAEAARVGATLLQQGIAWDAFAQNGRLVVQTETRMLDLPEPNLVGAHQVDNAGLACTALLSLARLSIDDDAFARGVTHAVWPGRMQRLTHGHLAELARPFDAEVWIDGGHNAHAARALMAALAQLNRKRAAKTALIVGLRARKDWRAFANALRDAADLAIAIPLADGAPPTELATALGAHAKTASDLDSAMQNALDLGAERVVICGSFLLVAKALSDSAELT